ncbi:PIR Superfamily Protein [Plasmodium ovale wallikeri]|uniref:PIR Superfamily Protein n=1 Tax=Plasmodium ovale wallikeri TaxID=864142 RepID=A0A1A9API3_PLAOA|nr:PIR Superfamily Protein [Plasmodium ovale wallikeri]
MYNFCINSPYYQMVVENISKEKQIQAKEDVQKIEDVCNSLSNDVCSSENPNGKEICKNILYMYKFLDKVQRSRKPPSTITNEDLEFLNYWLNVKLKSGNGNASICINEFNRKIKTESENFISSNINLENHFHVIDLDKLENMELLYELYDNSRNILDMMRGQVYTDDERKKEEQKLCSYYTEDCNKKYIKAMDKCLNGNADFYKALQDFKINYIAVEVETQDLKGCKSSPYFHLPKYDPLAEKKRNIMAGKILSAPLMLSFVIPLLYKYTPLGPLLRKKINTVKNKWTNSDEYRNELSLLPTDMEDNISDNGEYNIGYYSETN